MVMGQTIATTEVLVIGAGPGGYVAAIRAAQLGYKVMLVDRAGELGGMCLHHGCIPSKALIHAMNIYYGMQHAQDIGVFLENPRIDYSKTQEWKQDVINKLYSGITGLMKQHSVQVVKAHARFQNNTQCVLEGEDLDFNAVEFRYAIIATGSKPRSFPNVEFGEHILSSKEMLQLQKVPESLAVIGGGYIGIELGVMMTKAGAQVIILEGTDQLLGAVEPELAQVAEKRLEELGITVLKNTKVNSIENTELGVRIVADHDIEVSKCLVAIGHVPVTDGLQLDTIGVETDERGFIPVDEQCRTRVKNIYAIGDVTGGVMLAHKASAQGRVAAEAIAELPSAFDNQVIPAVVFSDPEIATVGLREQEAKDQYGDIRVGVFPFKALGKAIAVKETDGFVKIISDAQGIVLGVHCVGPGVTDYIAEAALAIEMGATAEDISSTIHPHPTLAESISEAADVLMGQAIHIYQPRKK